MAKNANSRAKQKQLQTSQYQVKREDLTSEIDVKAATFPRETLLVVLT